MKITFCRLYFIHSISRRRVNFRPIRVCINIAPGVLEPEEISKSCEGLCESLVIQVQIYFKTVSFFEIETTSVRILACRYIGLFIVL